MKIRIISSSEFSTYVYRGPVYRKVADDLIIVDDFVEVETQAPSLAKARNNIRWRLANAYAKEQHISNPKLTGIRIDTGKVSRIDIPSSGDNSRQTPSDKVEISDNSQKFDEQMSIFDLPEMD